MLKYIISIALAFSLIGCQGDTDTAQQAPPEQPMQDPMQQQQPAASIDISDDELDQFVEVTAAAQEVQMEAQQEMIAIVEEEDLEIETYNQIAQGLQMGQSPEDLDVSESDLEKYERASESIADIEQRLDDDFENTITEAGMSLDRFQEINLAVQQDPELQQRIQEKLQGEMMQQQQPQDQDYE